MEDAVDAVKTTLNTSDINDLRITEKLITATWTTPQTFVYDGMSHGVEANLVGVYEIDVSDVSVSYLSGSTTSAIDTGSYFVTVEGLNGSSATNYSLGSTTYTVNWSITVRQLELVCESVNLDADNKAVYSASNNIGKKLIISNIVSGDKIKLSGVLTGEFNDANVLNNIITANDLGNGTYEFLGQNVGYRNITINGLANDSSTQNANYTLGSTSSSFEIIPKTINLIWHATEGHGFDSNFVTTYDKTEKTIYAIFESGATEVNDGKVYAIDYDSISLSYVNNSKINAGSYQASATLSGTNNYVINNENTKKDYQILTRGVTISFEPTTSNSGYKDVYDANKHGVIIIFENIVSGDIVNINPTLESSSMNLEFVDGNYRVTAILTDTYSVTINEISGNANYHLDLSANPDGFTQDFEILKRSITLEWGYTTFTYNGNTQGPILPAILNLVTGDDVSVNWDANYTNTAINKGNYIAGVLSSLSGNDAGNYDITGETLTKDWEIMAKTLELSWENYFEDYQSGDLPSITEDSPINVIYDKNYYGKVLTVNGIVGSDQIGLSVALNNENIVANPIDFSAIENNSSITFKSNLAFEAGYVISINAVTENNNYNLPLSNTLKTFTINKKILTFIWNDEKTFTYDKTEKTVEGNFGPNEVITGDDVDVHFDNSGIFNNERSYHSSAVNAGLYTSKILSLNGEDSANYKLSPSTVMSVDWEIKAKIAEFTWVGQEFYIYDKTQKLAEAEITNLISGDEITFTYDNSGAEENGRKLNNVATIKGQYKAKVLSVTNPNYTLVGTASDLTFDWEIRTADITNIALSNKTVLYDGNNHNIVVNETVTQYGDAISVTYQITPNGGIAENGNSAKYVHIYNGDVSYYTIDATINAGENYNELNLSARLQINQASMIFNWTQILLNSENQAEYDGAEHGFKLTTENIIGNDIVKVQATYQGQFVKKDLDANQALINTTEYYTTGKNVDTYVVRILSLDNTNYKLGGVLQQTFDILPITLNIDWTGQTSSFEYDGSQKTVEGTLIGVLTEDQLDVSLIFDNSALVENSRYLNSKGIRAKQYLSRALNIEGEKAGNYILSSSDREYQWEITPKVLEIIWNGQSSYTYNNTTRNISASLTNVVSGDEVLLTYKTTGNSPAPDSRLYAISAKDAGEYRAEISSISNTDYILNAQSIYFDWVINKANINNISLQGEEYIYDKNAHPITLVVNGEEIKVVGTSHEFMTQFGDAVTINYEIKGSNEGDDFYVQGNNKINVYFIEDEISYYIVKGTINGGTNYNNFEQTANLKILQRDISDITVEENKTVTYNGKEHSIAYSFTNSGNTDLGDPIEVVQTINENSGNSAKNAGIYTILTTARVLSNGEPNLNYKEFNVSRILSINKANMVNRDNGNAITYIDQNVTYTASTIYLNVEESSVGSNKKLVLDIKPQDVILDADYTGDIANISYKYSTTDGVYDLDFNGVKDANTYYVKAILTNQNYYDLILIATLTIDKKNIGDLSLYFVGYTQDYDSEYHSIGINTINEVNYNINTSVALLGSDTGIVTYTYKYNSGDGYPQEATPFNSSIIRNAGQYQIFAKIDGGSNYVSDSKDALVVIEKVDVTGINLEGTGTHIYNGEYQLVNVSKNTTQFNEEISIDYTLTPENVESGAPNNGAKNVGEYTITVTFNLGGTNQNYNETYIEGNLTITKANMYNIEGNSNLFYLLNAEIDYSATKHYLNIQTQNTSGLSDNQVINYNIVPTNNTNLTPSEIGVVRYQYKLSTDTSYADFAGVTNAGTYDIKAIIQNPNYYDYELNATLTINKLERATIWTGLENTYIYNGFSQNNSITASFDALPQDGGNTDLAISYSYSEVLEGEYVNTLEFKDAGYYNLNVNSPNPNYELINNAKALQMLKANINLLFGNRTVGYTNTTYYLSANITEDYSGSYINGTNETNHNGLGTDIWNVKYFVLSETGSYIIGDTIETYAEGLPGNRANEFTGDKNAGSYNIIAIIEESRNYNLWKKQGVLVINKADITNITFTDDNTSIYDKTIHEIEIENTNSETDKTQYGDNLTVSYDMNPLDESLDYSQLIKNRARSAGSYTVTATITAGDNYNDLILSANLNIAKANIYNVLDDQHLGQFYLHNQNGNDAIIYDGYTHFLNVVSSSSDSSLSLSQITLIDVHPHTNHNVAADSASIEYTVNGSSFEGAKNKGIYNIKAVLKNKNYNDLELNAVLEILPYETTVAWVGIIDENLNDIVYTYNGYDQKGKISATYKQVAGDGGQYVPANITIEYKLTEDASYNTTNQFKNAGYYKFTISAPNDNYIFNTNDVQKNKKMEKADIDYTFIGNNIVFDNEFHYIGASTSPTIPNTDPYLARPMKISLLGSDTGVIDYTYTVNELGFSYEGNWLYFNGAKNAGTYYIKAAIEVSVDLAVNYNTWEKEAILEINKANITNITLENKTVTYNGALHTIEVSGNTTQHGIAVEVLYSINPIDTESDKGAISAGNYVVTAIVNSDNANYNSNYYTLSLDADLIINKAVMYNIDGGAEDFYFNNVTTEYNSYLQYLNVVAFSGESNLAASQVTSLNISPLGESHTDIAAITYKYSQTENIYNMDFNGVKDKGTYYIQATLENSNYISKTYTAKLIINPKQVELIVSGFDESYTYNGSDQISSLNAYYTPINADVLYEGYVIVVTPQILYSQNNDENYENTIIFKNAGEYKFVFSNELNSNYEFTETEKILTMDKADIALYMLDNTVTYDATTHYLSASTSQEIANPAYQTQYQLLGEDIATVTYKFTENESGFSYTGTWNDFEGVINAGKYYIKANIDIENSYNYNEWQSSQAVLTIEISSILGLSLTGQGVYTYDGTIRIVELQNENEVEPVNTTQHGEVVTLYYTISPEDLAVEYAGDLDKNRAKSVGTYVITATLNDPDKDGYNPNYTKLTLQATLTIEKAIMYNNEDKSNVFYFNSAEITFNGAMHFLNIVTTEMQTSLATERVDTLEIRPFEDSMTIDSATITYMFSTTEGVYNNVFNGVRNKGIYYMQATMENKNYITQEYTAILTINAYKAEIIWLGFDNEYTYNGYSQKNKLSAYYTMAEFEQSEGQETRNIALDIYRENNGSYELINDFYIAGNYDFRAKTSDSVHSNYDFSETDTSKILEMKKADINMYMVGRNLEYNGYVQYIGVSESSTVSNAENVTSINLLGLDTADVSYTFTTSENNIPNVFEGKKDAGTYIIRATIIPHTPEGNSYDVKDNYNYEEWNDNENYNTASLVITRKTITVTSTSSLGDWTKVYDATIAYEDFEATGFVSVVNDDETVNEEDLFNIIATYQNKNVGSDKIITFAIVNKSTSETSKNYTISQVLTGKIIAHKLIPTLTNWTKVYDGNNYYGKITTFIEDPFAGIYPGDVVDVDAYFNSKNVTSINSEQIYIPDDYAKSIYFELSGNDKNNYIIDEIDNENANVSITQRDVSVVWGNTQMVYSGVENATTAYFELVGNDRTTANEGKEILIVRYYEEETNNEVIFRNAGHYIGKAFINDESTDIDGVKYTWNYNVSLEENEKELEILSLLKEVEWNNLPLENYIYNGTIRGTDINAKIDVVGTDRGIQGVVNDKMTLDIVIRTGGAVVSEIKNAGIYTLTATITYVYDDGFEMKFNYSLSNSMKEITVEKADMTNIYFSGRDEFVYWAGETHSYYVVNQDSENAFSPTESTIYYQYDGNEEIQVIYNGGDTQFAGGNTVKNVGEYTIKATVLATNNYNGFEGFVTVVITKGDISEEFVYYDRTMDYIGDYVFLYLTQDELTPNNIFQNIYYPDSTTPSVIYEYLVPSADGYWKVLENTVDGQTTYEVVEYDNSIHENSNRYNYAEFTNQTARNAGVYFLRASINETGNYTEFSDVAILEIKKITRDVLWYYTDSIQGRKSLDQASIIFDETDKYTNLSAEINSVGTDKTIIAGENVNKIILDIPRDKIIPEDIAKFTYDQAKNDYEFNNGVLGEFRMAGNYSISAEFKSSDNSLYFYSTNYNLRLTPVQTRIEKYNLQVKWFRNNQAIEYIDDNPFVYDGNNHGVNPIGYGLQTYEFPQGIVIPIVLTANLEKNAGRYRSTITRIKGGDIEADDILTDGNIWSGGTPQVGYLFDYNYKLPGDSSLDSRRYKDWEIIKRQLSIIQGTTSGFKLDSEGNPVGLYKFYDGTTLFTLESTIVSNQIITTDNAEGMSFNVAHLYKSTLLQGGSRFLWEIDNLIESDIDNVSISIENINSYLRTSSDDVLKKNITSNLAKIVFNAFTHHNYYLFVITDESEVQSFEVYESDSSAENPLIVRPRPIRLKKDNIVSSYDGNGFDLELNFANHINTKDGLEVIESIEDGVNNYAFINGIYEDDYFNGRIYIEGNDFEGNFVMGDEAKDAGKYSIVIEEGFTTFDSDGVTNYEVTIDESIGEYTIKQRVLSLEYNDALQDLFSVKNGNAKDVTVNKIGMLANDEHPITQDEFDALLIADGLSQSSFDIKNAWLSDAMNSNFYTLYVGAKDDTENNDVKLGITILNDRNRHNYTYNAPVLQITGVRLADDPNADKEYLFKIESSEDLNNFAYDVENLKATLENYNVGKHPTYYQLSDIIASYEGRPIILRSISSFAGNYFGGGHNIIGLTIIASGKDQNTAMFNLLTGKISGMNLRKTTVVAHNSSYVAPIAAEVNGGIIENSSFEGVISSHAESKSLTVGGLIGLLIKGSVENSYSVAKIFAKTNGNINVGALIGETKNDNEEEQIISNVGSFIEANLDNVPNENNDVVAPVFNSVVGKGSANIISDIVFKNGVVINGERLDLINSKTYDEIMVENSTVSSIIYDWVLNRAYTGNKNGTLTDPFMLSFYTQFSLIRAYPYACFKLARTFIIPYNVKASDVQLDLVFYGAGFDSNGKKIYSRNLSVPTNLFKYVIPDTAKNIVVEPIGEIDPGA